MKKIWIWVSIILLLILLAIRGVPFLINIYLNDNAERIVSNMIIRTSGFAEHQVQFGNILLDYNYSGTYLEIEEINITPLDNTNKLDLRINLNAKKARISGFSWVNFLLNNSIVVDSAFLDQIFIKSITPPLDSIKIAESGSPKKSERDYDVIRVNHFDLTRLEFENRDSYTDSVRLQINDLSVHAMDFELTKEDIFSQDALFKVATIKGDIKHSTVNFDEYRQYIKVTGLQFDTDKRDMDIENFSLIHKLDKYAYTALFPKRKSWIEIHDSKLKIRGMNFDAYFQEGGLEVDSLIVDNLLINVFMDKRKDEDLEKRTLMIHEILQDLGIVIHIPVAILNQGHIEVEERPDNNSPTSGKVFFSDLNAKISNISNDQEKLNVEDHMKIDVTANLMDQGILNAHIDYYLKSEEGRFDITGTLGKMPVSVVNSIVETEAKVSLKSGIVNRLDFNIEGNNYDGSGEVIIRYEDLEIELLNSEFEKDQNLLRKIGTFIANKIVIKSNNPNNRGELKKGKVYFIRDPHKSILNFWWKLIFSGLKSTLTGEELEELKKREQEKDNMSKSDIRKENRAERRLARSTQ